LSPTNGTVSLKVIGEKDNLEQAVDSEFHVFLNLEGLKAGDHEVDIVVDGLKDVQWELSEKKAKIRLIEKENV